MTLIGDASSRWALLLLVVEFVQIAVGLTQVPQAQALLVGVTHRDLVLIDELNPSAVVSLGAHGLDGLSARSLAFDPGTGTLYGLASNRTTGIQKLVSYDLGTGAATVVADLGSLPSVGYFETLAFDTDANRLVASKASNPATWVSDWPTPTVSTSTTS